MPRSSAGCPVAGGGEQYSVMQSWAAHVGWVVRSGLNGERRDRTVTAALPLWAVQLLRPSHHP
jgi:hypothetical protein